MNTHEYITEVKLMLFCVDCQITVSIFSYSFYVDAGTYSICEFICSKPTVSEDLCEFIHSACLFVFVLHAGLL